MVVTAEVPKSRELPELTAKDVLIPDREKFQVEDLTPLRGDRAGLQLAILIDDGSGTDLGLQLDDLRKFIREQPSTTQVGIYYIANGRAVPYQAMTADHEAAASRIRLPVGEPGIAASPYLAISDFIKKWPATQDRREILLISSGIDLYRGTPTQNPYLTASIADAQRARVLVHSIYFAGNGHAGHDYFLMNFGRDNLSLLGDGTGGEAYWQGLSTSVSFQPYLDDLNVRLGHQYLSTLTATPEKKGRFERIRLRTEVKYVELLTAEQVWIPGF
jgi:hypothetical protein